MSTDVSNTVSSQGLQASFVRFMIAIFSAATVTFAVFWMMHGLISSGKSVIAEQDYGKLIEFVDVSQDDDLQTKQRKPKKPPAPPKEPPKPALPKPSVSNDSVTPLSIAALNVGTDMNIEAGLSGGTGDGEYLPIVKVAPQYPRRAAQRGIEGYVVVEFDVTTLGTVANARVIESDPPNIFNRAAISAANKFKYKPKMVNGKAVEVKGVRNLIRFELDKSSQR